jgi:ABC-2 type transport system ATP-binding protein
MTSPPCAPDTPTVLRACKLSKSYGSKLALKSVDLCLRPGQFVALLGPNGAGKSTLMQILSGLFVADSGQLSILGHDMHTQATRALAGLGMVFQQSSLDLDLSVQANLLFHTDLHGIPRTTALHRIAEFPKDWNATACKPTPAPQCGHYRAVVGARWNLSGRCCTSPSCC